MLRKKEGKKSRSTGFLTVFAAMFLLLVLVMQCGQGEQGGSVSAVKAIRGADDILDRIDVSRGICVVLGDTLCELSRELALKSELLIYAQFPDEAQAAAAREVVDAAGLYGSRIYVEQGSLERIHLADNLADALVVVGDGADVSKEEALRVVRPQGVAIVGENEWRKPFPEGVDDWSHPRHGPDNNTQSNDTVIKAPYLSQFFARPYYGPATQVAVASAGRLFKAFGNVAFHKREEAFLNTLVCFNGYNGTMLWKRDLVPGFMVHRNIIIATPQKLFLGDDKSCKVLDTKNGRIIDEIAPPRQVAGGTYWKWMGLEDGVLYALIGEQEQKDPVMRWRRTKHGWPWDAISQGYNQEENPWGFGRNLLAIDPGSHKVLWSYHEDKPADSRALCMKNGRIYMFRFGDYLTCIDAKSGKIVWRKTKENAPDLFEALGDYLNRQGYTTNWRTTTYAMCSDDAIYFAGPQVNKLLAVSTKDGSVLWENEFNNFQLVLRDDGLYGIAGPWRNNVSKKFDPLTGDILAELPAGRRACTRPNATSDAIFYRASGGTVRLDVAQEKQEWISPMRPPCQDGVTIANGGLYWWPYVCDCQLSIYGFIGNVSAGDFEFNTQATASERLQKKAASEKESLLITSSDWPTFRQDYSGYASTKARIAKDGRQLWRYPPAAVVSAGTNVLGHAWYPRPTPPVTADGYAFWGDSQGRVHAVDVQSGRLLWTAYTGGAIRIAPTVWRDCLFVGSGDGWVYNFDARSGELNWRFRAAPVERKIPVYGSLLSTWPAASGVLVRDGIAYVAAGIVNYDGIHVYALNARTGEIVWQNNSSGHLLPEARTGVSVMGHLLIHNDKLYLAGGTSVSPAVYDLADGRCLNDPVPLEKCESTDPRGWELYLIGDHVVVSGKPFYSSPEHRIYDPSVTEKLLHSPNGKRDILWVNQKKILCYPKIKKETLNKSVSEPGYAGYKAPVWGRLELPKKPKWEVNCDESVAIAVCDNAVVVAEKSELTVLNIRNGDVLWSQPLEAAPVPWGLAVSRDGRIIVTFEDMSVQCFGGEATTPVPYVSSNNLFFVGSAKVTLACDTRRADIRYTLDGSEPTAASMLYKKPFIVNDSTLLKMRALKNGMPPGFVVSKQFMKVSYQNATDPGHIKPGVLYNYYEGFINTTQDLDKLKPVRSGVMNKFELDPSTMRANDFGYIYSGTILAPKEGVYTFYTASNDGSVLFVNGQKIVDNDGGHTVVEKSGKIALKAGEYPITVKYFQMGGGKALQVSWEGPGIAKREITAEVLFRKAEEEKN